MRLVGNHNDTFNHGPDGHPSASWSAPITPDRLCEILATHSASRSVYNDGIYLRGRELGGYQVKDMPPELMDSLGIPAVNDGERPAGPVSEYVMCKVPGCELEIGHVGAHGRVTT